MYKAKHYIRLRGKVFGIGEILPDGLPADVTDRLLKVGAIIPVASTVSEEPVTEEEEVEIADIDALDGIAEQPTKKKAERRKRK